MSVTALRDLRSSFGVARDQGCRPTCCAFACSDLHAACRMPWADLSCEYAFFHGVRRQGTAPTKGVHFHVMLNVLEQDGQPLDTAWPYLASLPNDLNLWTPPADAGQLFSAIGTRQQGDVRAIRNALDQGAAVAVTLMLSMAFFIGPDNDGVIDAMEVPDPTRVHAVVAVGYGKQGTAGMTLVRNSWGSGWGIAGHAWLADQYLAPRILEIATLQKVP